MKKLMFLVFAIALFAFVTPVNASKPDGPNTNAGPDQKATGSVMWLSKDGTITRWGEFDAHAVQGDRPAKGNFSYWDSKGNTFEVAVDTMDYIGGNEACFSGVTYNATGDYSGFNNVRRYWYVVDGGEPQDDEIIGNWKGYGSNSCDDLMSKSPLRVMSGNIQVHTFE